MKFPPFVAKIIYPDGRIAEVQSKDGRYFSWEEMKGIVGGRIEIIYPKSSHGAVMVINEEGKLIGLPLNTTASAIWLESGETLPGDYIVGVALLCHDSQLQRDEL